MNIKDIAAKIANITGLVFGIGTMFTSQTKPPKDDAALQRGADSSMAIADILTISASMREKLKLDGAAALEGIAGPVGQIIVRTEAMAGRDIVDDAEFSAGVKEIASGWYKVFKATKRK